LEEVKNVLNIDTDARSPFDYKIYFTSGNTETGFDYINLASNHWDLDWYKKSDASRDDATVNMLEARWNGKDDGSLILSGEHIHWTPDKNDTETGIEKIAFTPARKGYLSSDDYSD
jgi:hypothetical protein